MSQTETGEHGTLVNAVLQCAVFRTNKQSITREQRLKFNKILKD